MKARNHKIRTSAPKSAEQRRKGASFEREVAHAFGACAICERLSRVGTSLVCARCR